VGIGKSRSNKELLENLIEMPKTVVVSGYITAKKFFRLIEELKDCVIVFDEADMLLENRQITQMMKTLLTNKKAVWFTDREELETDFQGAIILNTNRDFSEDIEDKVIVNHKSLSTEQIRENINHARNYQPNMEIWKQIADRVVWARNNPNENRLTEQEKDFVYEFINELPYLKSFRTRDRILETFECLKRLFGCFNRDIFDLGKRLSRKFTSKDVVMSILSEYEPNVAIEKKELKEKIAKARSISTRQANKIVNNLINDEVLTEINRTKVSRSS